MTTCRQLLLCLSMLILWTPAFAQDEPLLGDETPPPAPPPAPEAQPPPPPPPPPAVQPAPAPSPATTTMATPVVGEMTPRKKKDITDTDHDMVIKDVGLQIVFITNVGPMIGMGGGGSTTTALTEQSQEEVTDPPSGSGDSQAQMGVRVWFTRTVGMDAGLGMWIGKPLGDDVDTQVGFSMYAGVPFALGVYRHVTMFAGPDVGFGFYHMAEDFDNWVFMLKGRAGIEVHLGFIDIPRVSLMGTMGLGLRVYNDGDSTELVFANDQGFTAESLFETSIGLIFYI